MRFNCGPSLSQRWRRRRAKAEQKIREGYQKFLWWPTRFEEDDCRWLEWVQVTLRYNESRYDFRPFNRFYYYNWKTKDGVQTMRYR